MATELEQLLQAVREGGVTAADAERTIRDLVRLGASDAVASLGFATVDQDRARRCGAAEVIFGQGKTPEQVVGIAEAILKRSPAVLATRLKPEALAAVKAHFGDRLHAVSDLAGTALVGVPKVEPESGGVPDDDAEPAAIPIVAAGTSDLAVAEEATLTCTALGQPTLPINDVGVAGLHRILARVDDLRSANVVVVVAGMEGALPSVVAGLVDAPVIAVPTSVGYGASFGGVAALLGMLNSCGSGVTVVNIDNGFGAGFAASKINRLAPRTHARKQERE